MGAFDDVFGDIFSGLGKKSETPKPKEPSPNFTQEERRRGYISDLEGTVARMRYAGVTAVTLLHEHCSAITPNDNSWKVVERETETYLKRIEVLTKKAETALSAIKNMG